MTEDRPSRREILRAIMHSMAFHVLLIFWVAFDIFIVGVYGYGIITNEWTINPASLFTLLIVLLGGDIVIVPIWFMASVADDFFDPYLSVWEDKEAWE